MELKSDQLDIVRMHHGAAPNERSDPVADSDGRGDWFELSLGVLTSVVLHFMLLVGLAVVFSIVPQIQRPTEIVMVAADEGAAEWDTVLFQTVDKPNLTDVADSTAPAKTVPPPVLSVPTEPVLDPANDTVPKVVTRVPAPNTPVTAADARTAPAADAASADPIELDLSAALSGRTGEQKQALLREAGGNEGSERAVQLALAWLAEHQQADGSWRLDHQIGHCAGRCADPGLKAPARNGATALALLPFLGSGHTHKEGAYADVVKLGLQYLVDHLRDEPLGGSWMDEGQMYSHGLATIAVCEALAMSRDRTLFPAAQQAVDFIVAAQHAPQGGWRYRPGEPGDTTVTGWQFMALKTASMSYVHVPPETIRDAWSFIDSVELPTRFQYAYQSGGRYDPGARPRTKSDRHLATSAVGLLCRMYLGWDRQHKPLVEGIRWLSQRGPSQGAEPNLYYDYYATQVMRHFGGPSWDQWNLQLRDFLIGTQQQRGHAAGSWFFPGQHNQAGGRLYCTSMAAMILEVYYRHLPLYSKQATSQPFRL